MSHERRVHPRLDTSLSAEINTGRQLVTATAKNLSLGGVGLCLDHALQEQSLVGIGLFLVEEGVEDATTSPLNVQGQVIWTAPVDSGGFEVGIRFAPMQSDQLARLQQFLARLG